MAILQEEFIFEKNIPFRIFQTSEKQRELHCHRCLELNLVERGGGSYIIGGKIYTIEPGDIFVINNSEQHLALHGEQGLTLTVLIFETEIFWKDRHAKEFLGPFLDRREGFSNRISSKSQGYQAMYQLFEQMKEESKENRAGWQLVMESAASLLLALIYRYYNEKQEIGTPEGLDGSFGQLGRAFSYINTHFRENITLEQLAKETALSKTYLCKRFRDLTGQTIFEYIGQARIQYACYLLQTTDMPVAQVAMEAGFESVSYFNRTFKSRQGCTPGQFRRRERL